MRAKTEGKHEIRKRFAIVIGVAAAGVMALGAQTAAQTPAPTPPPPTCNGKPATIVGTEGSDSPLDGTPGRDVIVGTGGNDIDIFGGPGNDVICGGKGADLLTGGRGRDTLLGQAGGDALNGGIGKDRCEGGKGNDSTNPVSRADRAKYGAEVQGCEVEKSIKKSGFIPPKFH